MGLMRAQTMTYLSDSIDSGMSDGRYYNLPEATRVLKEIACPLL